MASLAYLILCLCLHACTARPLMVSDQETLTLQPSSKEVKTSAAERFVKNGEKASDRGANVEQLDNQKSSSVNEAGNIEGKEIKTSYSWKILQQAIGRETQKRTDRSTLESSPPSHAEENVSSKDSDTVEDIVVMDYAQPHRKPPIHNRGT